MSSHGGVLALTLSLLVGGCAAYRSVDAMKLANIGDGISVTPQRQWAAVESTANGMIWTIDGIGLDELRFYTGIAPGRPLFAIPGVERRDLPTYRADMLPDDIMELTSATLGKAGAQQIRTANLRPAPFGSLTGFRFDLAFVASGGLEMKGATLFAQRQDKLEIILFIAPAEYYFDHYAPAIDQLLASLKVPDAAQARATR